MAEILHQLRLVVYPIIYRVLYIQTVVVWDFRTINSSKGVFGISEMGETWKSQAKGTRGLDSSPRISGRYLKWRVGTEPYKAIFWGLGFPLHKPYPYSLYR